MENKILNLNIGELIVTNEPVAISTILGSCVSVCLYVENGGGGIIHYALPHSVRNDYGDALRYGDTAIELLIKQLSEYTKKSVRLFKAKIVGGAAGNHFEKSQIRVGPENITMAYKILAKYKIPIVGQDVGGISGRKILFYPQGGRLRTSFISAESVLAGYGDKKVRSSPMLSSILQNEIKDNSIDPLLLPSETSLAFRKNSSDELMTIKKKVQEVKDTVALIPEAASAVIAPQTKRKVLIVDDSRAIRNLLTEVLQGDQRFEVVGQAEDPLQAEVMMPVLKPDVITLDVHMPRMTGTKWLQTMAPKYGIPVVMVTSLEFENGNEVFEALELGAVDYIQKPSMRELSAFTPLFLEKVWNASQAKVRVLKPKSKSLLNSIKPANPSGLVVAIGASTGGTEAISEVLTSLPSQIPPIVIVQHIPPVFSRAFADRMNNLCVFEVKEAEHGDAVHANRVLIAPGGKQMKVVKKKTGLFVEVNDDEMVNRHKPSVDYLFKSVAEVLGQKSIGVILTGMGNDGSRGLLEMKQKGAITMSQDASSCVVYGMPKAAWDIGASQRQVSLELIPEKIMELVSAKKNAG